jgi:hypothetical protein
MKPSLTIDERGPILHVTTDAGEGVAIPLEPKTVLELAAGLERARAALKTGKGWSMLLRGLGRVLIDLAEDKENGASEPKK